MANLLDVFNGDNVGCSFFSFPVGMFIIFDSAPESIKNQFQGLVTENF